MCEPTHSINQYPTDDHDPGPPDDPTAPPPTNHGGGSTEARIKRGIGSKLWDWLKKWGNYWHLSRLGSGHSESIEWAHSKQLYLPSETRYEAKWWNRTVRLDGGFNFRGLSREEALECATGYAWTVSLGNLTLLRNFLKRSMESSEYPGKYARIMIDGMMNKTGRAELAKRIKKLAGVSDLYDLDYLYSDNARRYETVVHRLVGAPAPAQPELPRSGLINLILGYTRKRNLLVPEWADDDKLWVPKLVVVS